MKIRFFFQLFGVAPEEGVNHDVPVGAALHGAAEEEDLTGEHPVDQGDGLLTLVVDRDGNIDLSSDFFEKK